ncbi:hypothetical protein BRAFLDRAFT_203071 [Bathycoccus prasinos]|uniref:Sialyltransferase n=1 Tax=Bathycoccus prasinos TaxID=41875 RepID=K8F6H5_9CHLO|nr:hypothetical protein BRAFLDRAFT_203071 [Bathycoccus prasinos]CCO17188.1 hypothetical protein BRAFLDRAFT_203071 [Bathycoccus prasinos]|eukprot:XP_007512588.1 hypothetical protein BRAFLDRAFT_203071 [Bathycoccus prasinos]
MSLLLRAFHSRSTTNANTTTKTTKTSKKRCSSLLSSSSCAFLLLFLLLFLCLSFNLFDDESDDAQIALRRREEERDKEDDDAGGFTTTISSTNGIGDASVRRGKACGNAPKAFLPDDLAVFFDASFSNEEEEEEEETSKNVLEDVDDENEDEPDTFHNHDRRRRRRRQLLISRARAFANRNGLTMPTGCDEKMGFVKHENFGEGAKPRIVFKNEGEKMLKKCVETTKRGEDCVNINAVEAAKGIAKTSGFMTTTTSGGGGSSKKYQYESCALVGNGGSVLRKKFGKYINNHDVIVRFNMAPIGGFEQHVGNRTDVWVNGHEASKRLCCIGSAKMGAHAKDHVMWFPAKQNVIKSACEKRRIKTKALSDREIPGYVAKMNKMRYESRRLGLGKNYDNWLQLTTGAHGLFYFLSKCRRVSVYGFSVWKERNAMGENLDQYGGRKSKVHSGNIFHDWSMETNAWKILHVANVLDVCT